MLNFNTWECLRTYKGHTDEVSCVKVLDPARILTCSADRTIRIWEIGTGECLKKIQTNENTPNDIVLLSQDKIASFSQEEECIRIWDIENGVCLMELEGHEAEKYDDFVNVIKKLSSDRLLSGATDKKIKLWDLNTGLCLKIFVGHKDAVENLEILSDDKILSCSTDQTIKVWNLITGDCLQTLIGHASVEFYLKRE